MFKSSKTDEVKVGFRNTQIHNVIESKPIEKDNPHIEKIYDESLEYIYHSNHLNLIERGQKTKDDFLKELCTDLKEKGLNNDEVKYVSKKLEAYIWKHGILTTLIEDRDEITDIKLMAFDNVRIKNLGVRESCENIKFKDKKDMEDFIRRVAIRNNVPLANISSTVTFTDTTTYEKYLLRITISEKYINSDPNSYMHIRKFPKTKYLLDDLLELNMFSRNTKEYLSQSVKEGKIIIVVGKGSSGKSTLINALIEEIPHSKAGLIIQENPELFTSTHPEIMRQEVRLAKGDGKVSYTLKDLSINALLMDIDYFIIGEIKGEEAKYFQNAFYTGYACMATLHGISSTEGLDKLMDYMKYDTDYSRTDLLRMLSRVNTVIYMEDFKINELSEVVGFDNVKNELKYKIKIKEGKEIDLN